MAKPTHIFGWHAVQQLIEVAPEQVIQVYCLKGREDQRMTTLQADADRFGIRIQYTGRDALHRLAGSEHHQGIVAHIKPPPVLTDDDLWHIVDSKPQLLLLILDQVTDAHNLGACMRTAACMGVDAIICPKDHAASITGTTRKTAAGAVEVLPFIQVTNLARTIGLLQQKGIFVVGTILNEQAKPLAECDLRGNLAIVMGAEDTGLRRLTADSCDQLAYIPMYGSLQSLNVSVACGMALYEASRQRNA